MGWCTCGCVMKHNVCGNGDGMCVCVGVWMCVHVGWDGGRGRQGGDGVCVWQGLMGVSLCVCGGGGCGGEGLAGW